MAITPRLALITIVSTLAYLGLAVLGWGGVLPSSRTRHAGGGRDGPARERRTHPPPPGFCPRGDLWRRLAGLLHLGEPIVCSLAWLSRLYRSGFLGIVAAKMAAFNLLPLPPLTGGQIFWNLVDWRGPLADRFHVVLAWVGIVTTLILYLGCLYAIVQALIEG